MDQWLTLFPARKFWLNGSLRWRGHGFHLPDFALYDVLVYGFIGAAVAFFVAFLVILIIYHPKTDEISEYLTVAEHDLNSLLRSWGGGLSETKRKDIAKERAEWISMVKPGSEKRDLFSISAKRTWREDRQPPRAARLA